MPRKPSSKEENIARTRNAINANRIFETGEDFTEAANKYFDECDNHIDANGNTELYSEAGLCLGLYKYGSKHRIVTVQKLHDWFDNDDRPDLQEAVRMAYMRIQHQIETDPRYQEKGGMATRAIFELKQKYLGGKVDKAVAENKTVVKFDFGNLDMSDLK